MTIELGEFEDLELTYCPCDLCGIDKHQQPIYHAYREDDNGNKQPLTICEGCYNLEYYSEENE